MRRYVAEGSDLSRPMEIDFFVAIPNREAGEGVAAHTMELGFATSVEQDEATLEWTCYCTKTIVPSYAAVRTIGQQLDKIARKSAATPMDSNPLAIPSEPASSWKRIALVFKQPIVT